MNTITAKELAARLNGREYGSEITNDECKLAQKSGLLVIFGYSDDNIEFRGVFDDEIGCYNGGIIKFDKKGILPDFENLDSEEEAEAYFKRKPNAKEIDVAADYDDYTFFIMWNDSKVPAHTFEIMDEERKYCSGLVIDINIWI